MNQQDLAQTVLNLTQLDPLTFQHQLRTLLHQPRILHLLTEVLASSLPHPQKQLAATGINYIVLEKLNLNHELWAPVWRQFEQEVLGHRQVEQVQWRYLNILGKGLRQLMFDMEHHLPRVFNDAFPILTLRTKTLLFSAFLQTEATPTTQCSILRQNVQQFIAQIFNFVCWLHQQSRPTRDDLDLELFMADILEQLMLSLSCRSLVPEVLVHTEQLKKNRILFQLVGQWLLFEFGKSQYQSIKKDRFCKQRLNEIVFLSAKGSSQYQKIHCNTVKAKAISLFAVIVNQFDIQSRQVDFDHFQFLGLMEDLLPRVLEQAIRLSWIVQKQSSQVVDKVVISLLELLKVGCRFTFMLQFVNRVEEKIIFSLVYPLLAPNQEQTDLYSTSPLQFVRMTEQLTEHIEDRSLSPRNKAGELLQTIVNVKYCLALTVEANLKIIQSILLRNRSDIIDQLQRKYRCRVSVQASLTMLTLFSSSYLERREVLEQIKLRLLDLPETKQLKGMALAKLFLFISYNFTKIYEDREDHAAQYLRMAAKMIPEQSTVGRCSMQLIANCLEVGFGLQVWELLMDQVSNGKETSSLKILDKIIAENGKKLPFQLIQDMIKRVIGRLIVQYKRCAQIADGSHKVGGGPDLVDCLNILEEVTQQGYLLRENQGSLVSVIWQVFDLFEFTESIQFQDNILRIFNNIADTQSYLTEQYYQFVDKLPLITSKNTLSQDVIGTYTILLVKGGELFLEQDKIECLYATMQSLKVCYSNSKQEKVFKYLCVFFHYIYRSYGHKLKKDRELMDKVLQIYQENKREFSQETIAAIVNLFLIFEVTYGREYPKIIEQNSIVIFKGYQAQAAALNFGLIVLKNPRSQQTINYLRYSIRLLHYLRSLKSSKQPQECTYYTPNFPSITSIDPFKAVSDMLQILKTDLEPVLYDRLIQQLNQEINLSDLRDLLSRREVNAKLRTVVKVRQDD